MSRQKNSGQRLVDGVSRYFLKKYSPQAKEEHSDDELTRAGRSIGWHNSRRSYLGAVTASIEIPAIGDRGWREMIYGCGSRSHRDGRLNICHSSRFGNSVLGGQGRHSAGDIYRSHGSGVGHVHDIRQRGVCDGRSDNDSSSRCRNHLRRRNDGRGGRGIRGTRRSCLAKEGNAVLARR